MDRLVLTISFVLLVGCQSADYAPLTLGGPTRVPPPPTGVVGQQPSDFNFPRPSAPPNMGGYLSPRDSGQYWDTEQRGQTVVPAAHETTDAIDSLQRSDELSWGRAEDRLRGSSYRDIAAAPVVGTGANLPYGDTGTRQLAATGPTEPLVTAPPRVRGFSNTGGRQNISVPSELARSNEPLAQPSSDGTGVWQANQPRYDDMRR